MASRLPVINFPVFSSCCPGDLLTYYGGRVPSDFFGSEILAKVIFWVYERRCDFFGSRKKTGIFLGCEKGTKGFFWVC